MKKQLVVLGAAAIIAAAAVPALAFESEFHGMYRLREMTTNFQAAGLAGIEGALKTKAVAADPVKYTPAVAAANYNADEALLSSKKRSYTLFEQRARLQYIGKASDDLKLVTHFEIDSTWGDAAYQNGRGIGGGVGADTVNLETKSAYLDFNLPSTPINMKVGIQGFADAYKGIFLFDDVGGAVAAGKFGPATVTAAFLRTYDAGGAAALGKKNVDVYVLDAKMAPSKNLKLGASYYLANNDAYGPSYKTHTLGVNAAATLGAADVDAFLLYQIGDELYNATGRDLSAYAAQVAAKVKVGTVGTVRAAGLYASGNDGKDATKNGAFQNIMGTNSAAAAPGNVLGASASSGQYYSANMLIILRTIIAMDSDNSLVSSINNKDQGVMAGFLGFDANMSEKLSASVNAGFVWADKRNANSTSKDIAGATVTSAKSKYYGTELNLAVNYKLYSNLTATLQGAYVLLGDYYTPGAGKPELKDPYLAGVMMNYTF